MTYKLTLNMMMMVFIAMIKVLNYTLKMVFDAFELMNEMIAIIRKNYNRGTMMNMLMTLFMVKLMDAMINNSIAFVIDVLRITLKYINIAEVVEVIELLLIMLITLITSVGDLFATGSNTKALTVVLMRIMATVSVVSVVFNSRVRIGAYDGHNYEFCTTTVKGSIPLR